MTKKEFILNNVEKISALRKEGKTFNEIAELLGGNLKGPTLEYYYYNRNSSNKKKESVQSIFEKSIKYYSELTGKNSEEIMREIASEINKKSCKILDVRKKQVEDLMK